MLRKLIFFALISPPTPPPPPQTVGKDGFILVPTFEPSPKIYLLTVLGQYARGLQLTHYSHKQLHNKGPVL